MTLEPQASAPSSRLSRRIAVLAVGCALLFLCIVGSFLVGSSHISVESVLTYLQHPDGSNDSYIVNELRKTRTLLGVLVGVCLAVAGAVMQAVTRNPLADPGLLGVNAGASLAIAVGAAVFAVHSTVAQFFLALAGACIASLIVYLVGNAGPYGGTPVRLVLAGVAFSTAAGGATSALLMINPTAFNTFRFWDVGALTRTDISLLGLLVSALAGLGIIASIVPGLSALALGDDAATALGTRVKTVRTLALLALTLLCAVATAAAGPIGFVGLMVPYFAGVLVGAHRGWIIATCAVLGPVLVLSADILGRVLVRPAEMQVGLLTAFVGSPVLLLLVYKMRGIKR